MTNKINAINPLYFVVKINPLPAELFWSLNEYMFIFLCLLDTDLMQGVEIHTQSAK